MESNELYKILGRITYSFSRIDFLISHFAKDLGIVKNPFDFYARNNFAKKIVSLQSKAFKIQNDILRQEFIEWLNELDSLRQERNIIVHSIILTNSTDSDEHRLFNYRKSGEKTIREIHEYTTKDLRLIDQNLIDSHNKGYNLLEKLENRNNDSMSSQR